MIVPRVLLVERQLLIGEALCAVLEPSAEVRMAGTVAAVPPSWDADLQPDVVLIDVDGLADGVTRTLRRCAATFARARICCLGASARDQTLRECLAAGADGYVLKESTPAELIDALALVARGHHYVDPRIAGVPARRARPAAALPRPQRLLAREIEIVCLIAHGHSNATIGERLALSEKTVRGYVNRIFAKPHVDDRDPAGRRSSGVRAPGGSQGRPIA